MRLVLKSLAILSAVIIGAGLIVTGCNKASSTAVPTATASEVAVTATSGTVNAGDTTVGFLNTLPKRSTPAFEVIPSAYADNIFTCSTLPTITDNGTAVTKYTTAGDTYNYTPASCSISFGGATAITSSWSGYWIYAYNTSCSNTGTLADFKITQQPISCTLTRTTPTSGVTRSLTGPDGNTYAISHNTNGLSTGYNPNVTTTNAGVQFACTAGTPCSQGTITMNGSHLTGTYNGAAFWDHTVTTGTPLVIQTTSTTKTIASGTVVVQHNLLKTTSTSTYSNVAYIKAGCCFPVSGSISTTYSGGSLDGKTEALTFDGSSCGIGTITKTDGTTATISMIHCI